MFPRLLMLRAARSAALLYLFGFAVTGVPPVAPSRASAVRPACRVARPSVWGARHDL